MMRDSFSLSDVKKVRILDGEHSGKEGWVYERMLCRTSSPADQLAFARLYHMIDRNRVRLSTNVKRADYDGACR